MLLSYANVCLRLLRQTTDKLYTVLVKISEHLYHGLIAGSIVADVAPRCRVCARAQNIWEMDVRCVRVVSVVVLHLPAAGIRC